MIPGISAPGRDPIATLPLMRADGPVTTERWPSPNDVRLGVQYGPNGDDYTGALVGGGSIFLRRR